MMAKTDSRHYVYKFMAMRFLAICCLLLLIPVVLWSAVMGMVALCVTLYWMGSLGARSADSWASARANGSSPARAAAVAGWVRALFLLAAAVASALAIALILQHLTWVGEWLDGPGLIEPVLAVILLIVSGVPAMVVMSHAGRSSVADASAADGTGSAGVVSDRPRGRWFVLAVVAAVLGTANAVVVASLTPLGEWLGGGIGQRGIACLVLVVVFALPLVAVWFVHRGRVAPK